MDKIDFKDKIDLMAKNQRVNREKHKKGINKKVYTTIIHVRREVLGISIIEYCVAEMIYHFSNAPDSKKIGGWCFASKQHIADCLSVNKRTIERAINKLLDLKLIEKDLTSGQGDVGKKISF
ncbi:MAG TPA: hypothetical protein ENH91_00375 [Leeuwenhoekiella sp.]|nr:hypothetical protein [Leeuwenhoekiella sp.]